MGHIGNWSPDKRARVASELREKAAQWTPARLAPANATVILGCPNCRRAVVIDLRRMIARGQADRDVRALERKCSHCSHMGRIMVVPLEGWPERPGPVSVAVG